jgi:hypothetical protein
MEEAIPVFCEFERPKINRKSMQQKKEAFNKELEKTKKVLSAQSFKAPPIMSRQNSQNSLNSLNSSNSQRTNKGLFSMNSLNEEDSEETPVPENCRSNALGAMRDWRGVTESSDRKLSIGSDSGLTPRKLSGDSNSTMKPAGARKLSVMLRSTGGTKY